MEFLIEGRELTKTDLTRVNCKKERYVGAAANTVESFQRVDTHVKCVNPYNL
jgi:hypothetical protein